MTLDWNKYYPYFQPHEFICRCGCKMNEMKEYHLNMLLAARLDANILFVITSGFRCIDHNRRIGGARNSDHLGGYGTDIKCVSASHRWIMLNSLIKAGFNRLNISKTFIHAGCDPANPENVIWVR